jgi:tRNA (mo5U34)-methyltransferase
VSPSEPVPASEGDPRLSGWYHTIELGDGRVTRGFYDHRPVLDRYGIPDSLRGMSALDVGAADGFFAFEFERRGAARVVATDVADRADWDWMPGVKSQSWLDGVGFGASQIERFQLAHTARRSKVEHRVMSVYDLAPETVGTFDLVFCGSLLLHLRDPLRALSRIRAVTGGMAIVETAADPELERAHPGDPVVRFGARDLEDVPGEKVTYWWLTPRALEDMLLYAGFEEVEHRGTFEVPPTGMPTAAAIAHPHRRRGLAAGLRRLTRRRRAAR